MFRVVPKAPLLAEAGLLALCPSLNSPVLNSDELPVGPARAAILVYAEEYGDLSVSVAVRSTATGDVQAFIYRGKPGDLANVNQAMDAALTFAEGMGFLFDDDWVPNQGKSAALELWMEITDEGLTPAPGESDELQLEELELSEESPFGPGEAGVEDGLPGLELDEVAELDLEDTPEIELGEGPSLELDAQPVAPSPADSSPQLDDVAALELDQPVSEGPRPSTAETTFPDHTPAAPADSDSDSSSGTGRAAPTLTKFRRPPEKRSKPQTKPACEPAQDAAAPGSELGRIALVRKRLGGGSEPVEKRSLLLRLLGQF